MLTSVQNFPLEEHDAADGAVPQREMGVVISGYFIVSSFFSSFTACSNAVR